LDKTFENLLGNSIALLKRWTIGRVPNITTEAAGEKAARLGAQSFSEAVRDDFPSDQNPRPKIQDLKPETYKLFLLTISLEGR